MIRTVFSICMVTAFIQPTPVWGENIRDTSVVSIEDAIATILEDEEDALTVEAITNDLHEMAAHPFPINSANADQWNKLFWLPAIKVQHIQDYIQNYGGIASRFELMYIPGITREDALILALFVDFEEVQTPRVLMETIPFNDGTYQLLLRSQQVIQKQTGFADSETHGFAGSPQKLFARYTYQLNDNIHAGYTAEKDAGEPFFRGTNRNGFDFNSFHMQINTGKLLKTLVVGDYQVNLGQGLISWLGYSLGKTSMVMSGMLRNSGITHYQVTDENRFYRGVAATLGRHDWSFSLWASRHAIDANITSEDSLTHNVKEVSSIQTTGSHATSSEIADEDALHQSLVGTRLEYNRKSFMIGLSWLYNYFDAVLNPPSKSYNLYYFRGRRNYNASIDYQVKRKNLVFFGEEAISKNGGYALLNGFQASVNSRISCNIISRYYKPSYQSIFGKAFGENSLISNEYGLFMGWELIPFKYTTINLFMDVFRFPWVRYGVDIPTSGHEFMLQVNFMTSEKYRMYLQYRNKVKQDIAVDSLQNDDQSEMETEDQIVNNATNRWRYNLNFSPGTGLKLTSRMEYSSDNQISGHPSHGYYIGQDANFKFRKLPMEISVHGAWFKTDNYNVRVYAYEPDMTYSFSIPVMYGEGCRTFLMLKYTVFKKWSFWVKYAETIYFNKSTIGSGLYTIHGNVKSEVKFQLLKKF